MKPIVIPAPVACYCRVSTENQIENYSIDEQKERLEAFCMECMILLYCNQT